MEKIGDWQWYDYEELGSTNDEVKKLCTTSGLKVVVTAKKQNNGRGRRGRSWVGLDGNLFMSAAMEIPFKDDVGQIVFVVTLAMLKTIKTLCPELNVRLKWPNDVLVGGCKISGILLEKANNDYLVMGIGVNIANSPEIEGIIYPTTNLRASGCQTDRITFLKIWLQKFDETFEAWQKQGFEALKQQWLAAAENLGKKIRVNMEKESREGIFAGIDNNGFLLLEQNGKIEKICAGDVFCL